MGVQEKSAKHFDALENIVEGFVRENPDLAPWGKRAAELVANLREDLKELDRKKKYADEVRIPIKGTLLVYQNGERHRPVRVRVKGVTPPYVTLLNVAGRDVRFHLSTGVRIQGGLTSHRIAAPDVIDGVELEGFKTELKKALTKT